MKMHNENYNNENGGNLSIREIRNYPVRLDYKRYLLSTYGTQNQNANKTTDKRLKNIKPTKYFTRIRKSFGLWNHTLKSIEINFGTNSMLYFTFIKLLFYLNLLITAALIAFIITPNILHTSSFVSSETSDYTINYTLILDVIQGTGILETSFIFYGYYTNSTINYMNLDYNFPLAYLLVYLIGLLFVAVVVIKISAKQTMFFGESIYAGMVYTSWVFQAATNSAVEKKHANISKEIISTFKINTEEEKRIVEYCEKKDKIITVRILVNLFFVIVLTASAFFIYYIFKISEENLLKYYDDLTLTLCFQFLPSLALIFISKIIPLIFSFLIKYELYSSVIQLKITLIRMVFVRMFSLVIVYVSLYNQLDGSECWENKIGQQMYKMLITEFLVQIISIFIIETLLTSLIRICKKTYSPVFDLPKNVLDAIYMQTLTWFGMFYSPILPIMFFLFTFILIYAKQFELYRTNPSNAFKNRYQSNSTYTSVLLISFNFAFIPLIFCISTLQSSPTCGPFKGYGISWDVIPDVITTWPDKLQTAIDEMQSLPIVSAIFIILLTALYTYISRISMNRFLITEIRKHLSHLGTTKQHLRNIYHKYNHVE